MVRAAVSQPLPISSHCDFFFYMAKKLLLFRIRFYIDFSSVNNLTDIDECQVFGTCSQRCTNLKGSHRCWCETDYIYHLVTGQCVATGTNVLVVVTEEELVTLSLAGNTRGADASLQYVRLTEVGT